MPNSCACKSIPLSDTSGQSVLYSEGTQYAVYGDTYAETIAKLTEVLANIDKGVFIISSNSTLSRWLREWLVDYALPTVKQSTYVSYEAYARLHVEPTLGRIKLSDLTVERFQKFFNKKHTATGAEKGLLKSYCATSIICCTTAWSKQSSMET